MKRIEEIAFKALIKEVELTPKPGLVDKINNGSHKDMDINTFYKSSNAIKPFISLFLYCGKNALHVEYLNLFNELRSIGKHCEKEMFLSTNGVNTHKGMIFSLAVICGAIGKIKIDNKSIDYILLQNEIRKICENLVENDLINNNKIKTNGEKFFQKTRLAGIRDEAQNGYPTIFQKSLPFYLEKIKHYDEDISLKLTLLFLMKNTIDSNLFARGGIQGINFVKKRAGMLLETEDISALDEDLLMFDSELIQRNLSPGGSADLLSLTWFLSKINQ